MIRLHLRWLFVSSLLALCACASASIEAPRSFATFEDAGGYLVRAANPEGVVVGVRAVPNDPEASVEFWKDLVQNQLEKGRGYAVLEQRKVKAGSGQTGIELRLGRDLAGEPYAYWVRIFVTKRHVYFVEAGGRQVRFDAAREDVERAMSQVRIRGK